MGDQLPLFDQSPVFVHSQVAGSERPSGDHDQITPQKSQSARFGKDSTGSNAASELLQLQQTFGAMEAGYHRAKQQAILRIYAIAGTLREDKEAWKTFCGLPEWTSYARPPSPKKRDRALRYALRLVIGFSEAATKDVSRYFRILKPHFDLKEPVHLLDEKVQQAGGLIALGKQRQAPPAMSVEDEDVSWAEDRYKSDLARLASSDALADRAARGVNVQGVLVESALFYKRNVIVPRQIARKARLRTWFGALELSWLLAADRDAWDQFCRLELWVKRKKRPHLNRPEHAFRFVVSFLSAQIGADLREDVAHRKALPVWELLAQRVKAKPNLQR